MPIVHCCYALVAPQIGIGFTFGEEPLNSGDTATITCSVVKGDSPVEIELSFRGEIIPETVDQSEIVISNSGKRAKQLLIESVHAKHAGEYTCIVSNKAGSTTRSTNLAVNGIFFLSFSRTHMAFLTANVVFIFSVNGKKLDNSNFFLLICSVTRRYFKKFQPHYSIAVLKMACLNV